VSVTKAIILAAGVGRRLRPLTDDRPKCLLEVGRRTLIEHQVATLRRCGIPDVIVVVGYCGDQIRQHLGSRVRYLDNEQYETTNSLYSLWLAREELVSGALILNSDVFALPRLFDRLLQSPAPDAILVERGHGFEAEDMKVTLNGSRVEDFGKDLPREHAQAHNVGVAKFSKEGAARLADCLERLVATGHENDWVPVAFREFASRWPLTAVATEGLPWIEIDYAEDLRRARLEIEPAILALDSAVPAR
jgi:L-glutamine-phosphate cytidylyltransferase